MRLRVLATLRFLNELKDRSRKDNIFNGAAALGFFLTLAIFPAMILVTGVIPYLPVPRVDQAIMELLRQALPRQAYELVHDVVQEVARTQRGGIASLGALATLWAASTGMHAVMRQLNVTYEVQEARGFLHARATAVGLSLLFGAGVLVAFSLVVLGNIGQRWLGEHLGFSAAWLAVFAVLRWTIVVLALMLAFSLTYYLAPNVKNTRFALITVGSVAGTVLLLVASAGFAAYVQSFGRYNALYGGIGAVVALMLWLYIAGFALLVGAEINVILERMARARGTGEG